MQDLLSIISHFRLEGTVQSVNPLGSGLINDTYKVTTAEPSAPDYVLQRINHAIFQDVDMLQANIEAVTRHIRAKLEARGERDIDRKVLRFLPAEGGKTYWQPARPSATSRPCWPTYPTSWARPFPTSTTWSSASASCARPWQPMPPGV